MGIMYEFDHHTPKEVNFFQVTERVSVCAH